MPTEVVFEDFPIPYDGKQIYMQFLELPKRNHYNRQVGEWWGSGFKPNISVRINTENKILEGITLYPPNLEDVVNEERSKWKRQPYIRRWPKIVKSLIKDYSKFAAENVGEDKFLESWNSLGKDFTKSLDIYGSYIFDNLSSAISSGIDTKTALNEIGVNAVIYETFDEYIKNRKLPVSDAVKALHVLSQSRYAKYAEPFLKEPKAKHNGSSKENDKIIRDFIEDIAVKVGAEMKPFEEVQNDWLKREKPRVEILSSHDNFTFTKGKLSEPSREAVKTAEPKIIEALNEGKIGLYEINTKALQ